jgi:membrane fusion protein (multidrug efflux system)
VALNPVKVELNVPERFVSRLQEKQKISLNVAAFLGRQFDGEVYFIAPQVDPSLRTVLVKARIPNPSLELKPGMFASLELTLNIRDQAIVIPETALNRVLDNNKAVIGVVDENETVKFVPITVGIRDRGVVEVTEGLKGGERVIIQGMQKVGPGSKVKAAS